MLQFLKTSISKLDREMEGGNLFKNKLLDSIPIVEEHKYWNYSLDDLISCVYTIESYYADYLQLYEVTEKKFLFQNK